ncbi:hypothetical protein MSAS_44420 [Mycobacterium saskatchewanense]|nr:hypothetical protein MSAS_44420 [Mycobacterium saskatchewanense]
MLPISTDAVVLAPLLPVVGAAPALVVDVGLLVVVVDEPPGGLAVELQPASASPAQADAAASLRE